MLQSQFDTANWSVMLEQLWRITSHRRWVTFQIQYLFALGFLLVFGVLCSCILLSARRPPMCGSSSHSLHSSARGTWAIKEVKTFAYLAFQLELVKKLCILCTTSAKPRNWNSAFPKACCLPDLKTRESNNRPTTAPKAVAFTWLLPWSFIQPSTPDPKPLGKPLTQHSKFGLVSEPQLLCFMLFKAQRVKVSP